MKKEEQILRQKAFLSPSDKKMSGHLATSINVRNSVIDSGIVELGFNCFHLSFICRWRMVR